MADTTFSCSACISGHIYRPVVEIIFVSLASHIVIARDTLGNQNKLIHIANTKNIKIHGLCV
jgi:hypothetical protein